MIRFLDLYSQYKTIKEDIDKAIYETINTSSFIGGEKVVNFEKAFSDYHGSKFCVSCANGTDALEIAIESLDLPKGSEIIVPANSFIASSEAVTRTGHKIIFADVDPERYTISLKNIEPLVTLRTKAIIVVHLYGQPADMNEIVNFALSNNIKIIEDCAQAHGAEYEGLRVGNFGDIATFSFYPGKNLGAYGDGGAIITNNEFLSEKCRLIANHGRKQKYDHLMEGRNSRLDSIQASILEVKLQRLNDWIEHRNKIATLYKKNLNDLYEKIKLPSLYKETRHAFHLFVIQVDNRDSLRQYLQESSIQTGIHYPTSLPNLKAYEKLRNQTHSPISDKISNRILSLPIGEHLSENDINKVSKKIRDFYS